MNCSKCGYGKAVTVKVKIRANPLKYRDKSHYENVTRYVCELKACILDEI